MEKRIKTVEVFIAKDGTEFMDKKECIKHEEWLKAEEESEREYKEALKHILPLEVCYEKGAMPEVIPFSVFTKNNGNIGAIKRVMSEASILRGPDYRFFKLESKKDAAALTVVIAHMLGTDSQKILKNTKKMCYPCIAVHSKNHSWTDGIVTFNGEMEPIRKYCRLHGYDITLTPIKESPKA